MIISALDDIDRQIIGIIAKDSSKSHSTIGEVVGLSASAINERIRKLQKMGVIEGYQARINPKTLGHNLLAFILVDVEATHEKEFAKLILENESILECHHVTGDYSFLVKVRVAGTDELEMIISKVLKVHPWVKRSHTQIALSSIKEEFFAGI